MYGWHSFGAGSRQQSGHHSQVKGARRRAGRQCMHIHPTDEVTPLASRETDGRAEDRLVQHGGGGKKRLSVNYSCRRPAAPALVGHIPTLAKCALQVFRLYSTRHHATYVLGMREAMFVYVQLHCRMIRAIHCHSETAPQRGQWKIECDVAADSWQPKQDDRLAGGQMRTAMTSNWHLQMFGDSARSREGEGDVWTELHRLRHHKRHITHPRNSAICGRKDSINGVLDTVSLNAPALTHVSDIRQRGLGATLSPVTAKGTLHHCRDAPLVRSPSKTKFEIKKATNLCLTDRSIGRGCRSVGWIGLGLD